jgi:cell division protein FtsW
MSLAWENIKSVLKRAEFADTPKVRKHRPDYQLAVYMGLLMLIGLVVIYAIGPQRANVLNNIYGSNYSDTYFFFKQLTSLLVALVAFFAFAYIPYTWLTKNSGKILVGAVFVNALLAIASFLQLDIAQQSLGASRWFNLGALGSFQPSELLKFGLMIFAAGILGYAMRQKRFNDWNATLIPVGVALIVAIFMIVVLQKDLGTGVSLAGIAGAMLMVGGINWRNGVLIILASVVLVFGLIVSAPHRVERWMTFIGDSSSSSYDSYHIDQAKLALGTGGLFGVGVGNSVQSTGYLPEAINDSVFAIMGETFGFVGLVAVLAIFGALLLRLLKIMDNITDSRLKLIVAGVFGWLGSHVMLNVASMTGIVPLTGITLPLLSFGGTSMLFIAAILGLVFQLSHYTDISINKEADYENFGSRRGVGRTRYSSRRRIS